MGNFTIVSALGNDTVSSVFSYQKNFSLDEILKDEDGYATFSFRADLSGVFWELNCKIKLNEDSKEEELILDAIVIDSSSSEQEVKEWKLPYTAPLNYK